MKKPNVLSANQSQEYLAGMGIDSADAPSWMQHITITEYTEYGLNPPSILTRHVSFLDWIGGATKETPAGSGKFMIEIGYGTGNWVGSTEERYILLHELAHSIVQDWDWPGGHTPKFYAELTRLCLKYDVSVHEMVECEEFYLQTMKNWWFGDPIPNVYNGVTMFNALNEFNIQHQHKWWENCTINE